MVRLLGLLSLLLVMGCHCCGGTVSACETGKCVRTAIKAKFENDRECIRKIFARATDTDLTPPVVELPGECERKPLRTFLKKVFARVEDAGDQIKEKLSQ